MRATDDEREQDRGTKSRGQRVRQQTQNEGKKVPDRVGWGEKSGPPAAFHRTV